MHSCSFEVALPWVTARESKLKMKLHLQWELGANMRLTCLFSRDRLHMCPLQRFEEKVHLDKFKCRLRCAPFDCVCRTTVHVKGTVPQLGTFAKLWWFFFILTLTIKSSIKLLIISDIYMGVHRCFPRNVSSILSTFFAMLQLFLELKSIHLGLFFFILDLVAALLSGHGCPV